MWTSLLLAFLAQPAAPQAQRVTFPTEDGLTLVADFHDLEGEAPTVICLHMFRSDRSAWKPMSAPLRQAGIQMLALDLRGQGESAPELAERSRERDPELFNAMYRDVFGALEFLRSRGEDTGRVSILGASVGCSVGIDALVRDPSHFRSIALMTPGARYLGVDTLAQLARWPDARVLVLSSSEEKPNVDPVAERLLDEGGPATRYEVVEGGGIHGTRMFGKVEGIQTTLLDFFKETLLVPDLAVPRFDPADPRVETAGFVRQVLRVSRTQPGEGDEPDATFTLLAFAVGDQVTLGAMTGQPFRGRLRLELNRLPVEAEWDTAGEGPVLFVDEGPPRLAYEGSRAAFNDVHWVALELPVGEAVVDGEAQLRLVFEPEGGAPVALPGGAEPFLARLVER